MKWINIILAALLLLCLAPMPYGYFQLVRLLATIAFAVMAVRYYKQRIIWLVYTFGILALMFQPFYKIAFGRTVWNFLDVIVAIGLIVLAVYEWRRDKGKAEQYRMAIPPVKTIGSPNSEQIEFILKGRLDPKVMVYVASEEDKSITDLFENQPEVLEVLGKMIGYQIVYLPLLIKGLKEQRVIQYRAPYLKNTEVEDAVIGNDYMLQFLDNPADRSRIKHGFIRTESIHRGEDGKDRAINRFYPLNSFEGESVTEQLHGIAKQIYAEKDDLMFSIQHKRLDDTQINYHKEIEEKRRICPQLGSEKEVRVCGAPPLTNIVNAEYRFNSQLDGENTDDLMEEVRERIAKLRKRGIAESILEQLIHPDNRLSHMVITNDYRILLPDYNDIEVKMEPLVKAVYFLFLKHPEGIKFKDLPDYRAELTGIYQQLRPNGLNERARQSIEDVTNPVLNSINEKCARIRGAFVGEFDDYMARSYYVDGRRGEAKKITLPRDLVVWEE